MSATEEFRRLVQVLFPKEAKLANKSLVRMVDKEIKKATMEQKTLRQKSEAQLGIIITPKFQTKSSKSRSKSKKKHSLSLELPKLRPNNSSHKNLAIIHGFNKDFTAGLTSVSPSNEDNIIVSPSSNISPPQSTASTTVSPENSYIGKELLKLPQLQYNAHSLPSSPSMNRTANQSRHNSMIYPSLASKVLQLQHASSLPNHHTRSRTCSELDIVSDTRLSRVYSSSKTNSMNDADIHYGNITMIDNTMLSAWSPTMKNINEDL